MLNFNFNLPEAQKQCAVEVKSKLEAVNGTLKAQYTQKEEIRFNNYLRQFKSKYRVQKGSDGIWEMLCYGGGDIEPYSLTELCCYKSFKSNKGVNILKTKLPEYCKITQEAGSELVFKFPNENLDEIAVIVRAKIRKILTPEQRQILSDRATRNFKIIDKNGDKTAQKPLSLDQACPPIAGKLTTKE